MWYPFAAKVYTSSGLGRVLDHLNPIDLKMDQDIKFSNSVARSGIVLRLKLIGNRNRWRRIKAMVQVKCRKIKVIQDQSNATIKIFDILKYCKQKAWEYEC